jgi:hypothetical protein
VIESLVTKAPDIFIDHFGRLGVFPKVQSLALSCVMDDEDDDVEVRKPLIFFILVPRGENIH